MEDDDWEVIGSEEGLEWEEIERSRSRSRSRSLSRSTTGSRSTSPSTRASASHASIAALAALEAELREAHARADRAEARARNADSISLGLQSQLLLARQEVLTLQVVVQQQRLENDQLTAAMMISSTPLPVKTSRACKDKRVSKAMKNVAPQNISLPKRKAWGKANHRTSTTGARHI